MGLNEWLGDRENVGSYAENVGRGSMMTATEAAEVRKQAEEQKPAPTATPTPTPLQPTDVKLVDSALTQVKEALTVNHGQANAAFTNQQAPVKPAATSHTSDSRYTVTLTLDPHVHTHFAEAAKQDERSLAKFLARHLRLHVDEVQKKAAEKKTQEEADKKF